MTGDPHKITDQQLGCSRQIRTPAVAVSMGAGATFGIVGPGTVARTFGVSVQVLPPQEEFDGVVSGCDIRLDAIGLVKRVLQQGRRDVVRMDLGAREREHRIGNDVQGRKFVLVRGAAIGRVHIVDQAFIQRPGVHLALPVIDNGVSEAENLGLLIRHAGRQPGFLRGLQGFGGRRCDQGLDSLLQGPGSDEAVFIPGQRNVGIGLDDACLFSGMALGRDPECERGDGQ